MKTLLRISLFFIIIQLFSCDDNNRIYHQNLKEIKLILDSTKYVYYPLPSIANLIDSSSKAILSKIDTVKNYKLFLDNDYEIFKNIIETNGFNDSIHQIFIDRLVIKDSSRNVIKREIISTRNLFIYCIHDYMKNIEKKPNYIQPIVIIYMTRDSINSFSNLDISYPTFNKESLKIILLSDSLQHSKTVFGNGISVRKNISKYQKTVQFEMEAFDIKLADTITHKIIF